MSINEASYLPNVIYFPAHTVLFQMARFWTINLVKLSGSREKCAAQCWDSLVVVSLKAHQLLTALLSPSGGKGSVGPEQDTIADVVGSITSKLTSILLICLEATSLTDLPVRL